MIAFRDILIFAGLMALAAAVIASLFPVGEGVSAVPACSDCAFKLTGGYWIRQYGNHAALYLGTREVARYGWAYRADDGKPLSIGRTSRVAQLCTSGCSAGWRTCRATARRRDSAATF